MAPKRKKQTRPKRRAAPARLPEWFGYACLVLAVVVHVGLIIHFNFTQDDAFITFRYAANFLDGHGLVYNYGERVEGYTNFLWTVFMIIGGLIGLDFVVFSQILGSVFGVGTILLLFLFARDIFAGVSRSHGTALGGVCCLIAGSVYSFAYWTVSGLETAAFTFMVLGSLYFFLRRSFLVAACLVLATLLRPEGGLVFAFLFLYEIISRRSLTRFALTLLVLYAVFLAPLAVFKVSYYKSLLPNPFYAKTTFNVRQVINGLDYTGRFFWHYLAAGAFILPAIILIRKIPPALRIILLFLPVYTAYIVFIGGDVLKVHRFFVPLFALYGIVAVSGIYRLFGGRAIFLLGIAALMVWQILIPRQYIHTFHRREVGLINKMDRFSQSLLENDQSDFTLAVTTIGLVGYRLMGHTIIDMLGLTDSTIARHPEADIEGLETTWRETHYNSEYLLTRQPDYILFSTGAKPSAPAERALYTYSAFLNNYRTIGFFFGANLHTVFKRYYPIPDSIERDVDVNFVQHFNDGINLLRKDNKAALSAFQSAMQYGPDRPYPYLYYFVSEAYRHLENIEMGYKFLKAGAEKDTLTFEIYKVLYTLEYRMGNYDAAQRYRSIVENLVPWYIPRLDSLVKGII